MYYKNEPSSYWSWWLALIAIVLVAPGVSRAQLLTEDFDYAIGSNLTANGWVQVRSGNTIVVDGENLDESGYPGSGIGGSVTIVLGDQSVKRTFATQDAGVVYASFLVRVVDASTTSNTGLFFWLGSIDTTIFSRRLSLYANKNDTDDLRFGVADSGGIQSTGYDFELDKTYLIVVKYEFGPGEDDDTISLWVDPEIEPVEPPADITRTVSSDASEIAEIVLSGEDSSNTPPTVTADSIRVDTSWLPAVLFSDDFDSGDTSAWSSTSP
jgi:hypothetical protein